MNGLSVWAQIVIHAQKFDDKIDSQPSAWTRNTMQTSKPVELSS